MAHDTELIPVSVVKPIVDTWVAEFESPQAAYQRLAANSTDKADTWRFRLSDGVKHARRGRSGHGERYVAARGWFAADVAALDWFDVDDFLSAAELTHLWRSSELSAYLPDDDSGWHDSEHDKWCAECGKTVDLDKGDLGVRVELGKMVNVRRRWSWWTLCAMCAAEKLPRVGTSGTRRISDEMLLRYYRAYVVDEYGVTDIAAKVWRRHGFNSQATCSAALLQAWGRFGWPTRKRWQTKSLNRKHGRKTNHKVPIGDLRKLHVLHTRGKKLSIYELSRRLYKKYGYTTPEAMQRAVSDGWKVLGLKARDRIEMTVEMSTTNGLSPRDYKKRYKARHEAGLNIHTMQPLRPTCKGKTQRGKPCRSSSLHDSEFCWAHDPRFDEERRSQTAAMRARNPLFDPTRLEPWEPVRAELERYFVTVGTWGPLEKVSGHQRQLLSHWKGDTTRQRIDRWKAARLRAAIGQAYELAGVQPVAEEAAA